MATRQELLLHLWKDVINGYLRDDALSSIVQSAHRNPDGPFGDTGPAITRMLDAGASPRDIT